MTHELPASHVQLKRVYEPAAPEDGVRVAAGTAQTCDAQ